METMIEKEDGFLCQMRGHLESIGLKCGDIKEGIFSVGMSGKDVLVSIDDETNELIMTCAVGKLGSIIGNDPFDAMNFLIAMLDQNVLIRPCAFAILTSGNEGDPADFPILLVNSRDALDIKEQDASKMAADMQKAIVFAEGLLEDVQRKPKTEFFSSQEPLDDAHKDAGSKREHDKPV